MSKTNTKANATEVKNTKTAAPAPAGITVAEFGAQVGLSQPYAAGALEVLTRLKKAKVTGKRSSDRGKPAVLFAVDPKTLASLQAAPKTETEETPAATETEPVAAE